MAVTLKLVFPPAVTVALPGCAVMAGTVFTVSAAAPLVTAGATVPAITAQPGNATVTAGGNTSFSVTATGTALSYQWQLSSGGGFANVTNNAVYSGATTATLSITGATAGMGGTQYQVVVTGTVAPAATSSVATLTVNTAPAITAQPGNTTVTAGGNTSFSVCLLYTSPSPRDRTRSRMPSSA